MNPRMLIVPICAFALEVCAAGQNFVNGDLEGPSPTQLAILPPGWQKVPSTDPICLATDGTLGDTPDLTDTLGPSAFTGIFGNPFSGSTFMSGERADSPGGNWDFQEGIMQGVSGFVPGSAYTIFLHQAVVKSYGSYDTSGSWGVYVGSTLAGITEPTSSQVPYDSYPFQWEERTISFIATSIYHMIKFLPVDDDTELYVLEPNGSLRMGIDMISILPGVHQTGVEEADNPNAMVLWPNPFTDQLSLQAPRGSTMGQVFVHAATGEVVRTSTLLNGDRSTTIDLSALKAGVYCVRIVVDGKEFRRIAIKE